MSKIERIQKKLTSSLKRWLKVPKNLSNDCFYSRSAKLQLPYTALVEEFKVAKARNQVTFEESKDPCIRNAEIRVDAGRKANTISAVKEAKERLRMVEITGIANKGKEGLGLTKRRYYSKSTKSERRDMIVQTVRDKEEESRMVKRTNLSKQGASTRWEVPQRRVKHDDVLRMSDTRLSFLIKAVYDLLPTPANKKTWFQEGG